MNMLSRSPSVFCSLALALPAALVACSEEASAPRGAANAPASGAEPAALVTRPPAELPNAHDMELVGAHDLHGRSAYQPVVHLYGERRILFVGHHAGEALNPDTGRLEPNGISILDVSDPSNPVLLSHVPPSGEASGTQHVQVCDGSALPSGDPARVYALRTNEQLSYEILDVTDPAAPSFLITVAETGLTVSGARQTHKAQWDCATGIGYLNGTAAGWRVPRILQAFDLSNPAEPRHIRDFALEGWQPGAEGEPPAESVSGLHQAFVVGDRMYLGYGSGGNGVLQIVDRVRFLNGDPAAPEPLAPTAENLRYPEIARLDMPTYWGAHTAKPLYDLAIPDYADNRDNRTMDFLVLVSESGSYRCQENRDVMFMIDITQEDKPFPVSTFQVPEEPGDFCNRGGRFGPHSPHDAYHPAFDHKLVILAYFNAGIRAVDIRDPFAPREVAYFIPEVTERTTESCIEIDGVEECLRAIQTNNVNIDDRGLIYALDRAGTGLHIIELTGAARAIIQP
jgi:hypothetical protein